MPARGLGHLEETATERPMCCEAAGNRPRLDCGSQARLADADPFEDHPFVLVGSAAVPHPACAPSRTAAQQHRSSGRQRGGWEMGVGIEV